MARGQLWTNERLDAASAELERGDSSWSEAARVSGCTGDYARQNLMNKVKALKSLKTRQPTPSEQRLIDAAAKHRETIPHQPRVADEKGTRLAKGAAITRNKKSPAKRRSELELAKMQLKVANDLEAAGLSEKLADVVRAAEPADPAWADLLIKLEAVRQRNYPKHIEGKHDLNHSHRHEVVGLSDEELAKQLDAMRKQKKMLLEMERDAKLLRPGETIIDVEYADVEVTHA